MEARQIVLEKVNPQTPLEGSFVSDFMSGLRRLRAQGCRITDCHQTVVPLKFARRLGSVNQYFRGERAINRLIFADSAIAALRHGPPRSALGTTQ